MTIDQIATEKNWNLRFLRAVAQVESSGNGFTGDHPKVRFEPHKFNKLSKITMPFTDSGKGFSRVASETNLKAFQTALKIDREAAISSTSFGAYQIMGFNWKTCGAKNLEDFYKGNFDPDAQLAYFVSFVGSHAGRRKILEKTDITLEDCKTFARLYNGSSNVEAYGKKIWNAYQKEVGK